MAGHSPPVLERYFLDKGMMMASGCESQGRELPSATFSTIFPNSLALWGGKVPFRVEDQMRSTATPAPATAPGAELLKLLSGLPLQKRGRTPAPAGKAGGEAEWPKEVREKIDGIYGPTVEWLVTQLKIEVEHAQDLVHEVLKRLPARRAARIMDWGRYLGCAAIREYRRSKTKPKVLLFSELEREDRERLFQIRAPGPTPAEEAAEREITALLPAEIEKLPTRQRQVLTLELEGKKPKEIQSILGLKKIGTVYAHRQKAIAKLRKNPVFCEEE